MLTLQNVLSVALFVIIVSICMGIGSKGLWIGVGCVLVLFGIILAVTILKPKKGGKR